MAAKKTIVQIAKRIAATLALVVAAFFLSAWIGSSIPRNSGWEEPETGVTIAIETNGIHTGIVMPLVTAQKDWRTNFPLEHIGLPNRDYTHVSVSFGERDVFLNTPRLQDIEPGVALKSAIGGDGLLHASHYVRPAPSDRFRTFTITEAQYALLVSAIERQMEPSAGAQIAGRYGNNDAFYDSDLTYYLGHTCNQWSANMLAEAGIKMGLWTPFSGGVMKWVERAD